MVFIVWKTWPFSGIGSEIDYNVQKYAFDYLDAPEKRVAQADTPLPFATTLIDASIPNAGNVIEAVKSVMYR